MQYRAWQDFTLSEIGVGCYALSGAYGQKDAQAYHRMLERAIQAGVTFFDTADTYGELAEELLGEAVHPYRQTVRLATKVGMRGEQKPDLSHEAVLRACEGSLRRLQTEYIDLYQVHFNDPVTPVAETVAALDDLVYTGKILRYGIGHLPMERVRTYLEMGSVFSGQFELSAVARETRAETLPLLQEHHAGLIAFSVTGRGLLTGRFTSKPIFEPGDIRNLDPLFQRERLASGLRIANQFAQLGCHYGKSSVQVAIAWVLAQPGVICALTGPSTIKHLEENLGSSGWKISGEHLSELEAFFASEDRQLRAAQAVSVQEILSHPLPDDHLQAVKNLVYAIETAVIAGWISQEAVMAIFLEVYQFRKNPTADTVKKLEKARRELCDLIRPAGLPEHTPSRQETSS